MERSQLLSEHCFYSSVPSRQQSKIYLFLHIHHQISLEMITKCINIYVDRHPQMRSDSSNTSRKYYSKPKNMEGLKSFHLHAIYYTDPWVDHFTEFLSIVTEQTGIIFPTTEVVKKNIIPNLINLKY